MQEEEKSAVTSDVSDSEAEAETQIEKETVDELASDPVELDSNSDSAPDLIEFHAESDPINPDDKITAIRTSLYQIAQLEEEEKSIPSRGASDQASEGAKRTSGKICAEAFSAKDNTQKEKKDNRSKIDRAFSTKGRYWYGDCAQMYFLVSVTVFLVCMILIAFYFVDIYRARELYDDIGSSYHARQPERVTESSE
ncbi:MAG: hypothetical protein LUC50_08530 [Ruminococcus sp.]|nr:hypothetical protein [Ruminococcus sp.]